MINAENEAEWDTVFAKNDVPIYKGGKRKNIINLMGGLALRSPSTTTEIARFILSHSLSPGQTSEISYHRVNVLAGEYNGLITHRKEKDKIYNGLVPNGFLCKVDERIKGRYRKNPIYFFTHKGALLVVGHKFNVTELQEVIKNLSSNTLFFAFVNSILEKTSISFVKNFFIEPIHEVYEKTKLFLDDDLEFYFVNIAGRIGKVIYQKLHFLSAKMLRGEKLLEREQIFVNFVEIMMDNNSYVERPKEDWADVMIEKYYRGKNDEGFYREFSNEFSDPKLLYQVMRGIHFAYYDAYDMPTPRKSSKKIRRSKRWREHIKYIKSNGVFF